MKKIYVGCSLAQAPQIFLDDIEQLKKLLAKHFQILEFLGQSQGTAADVFLHDIDSVKQADFLVVECTYPSTGLGFEIATALAEKIPVYAFAKNGAKVSRLLQGINEPGFALEWYTDIPEIVEVLKQYV